MRIVHLADLHLGFRQYQRVTANGINQREADVGSTFTRAIDRTIQLAPDVVLIAGDVFHAVRPSNPAILHAFTQFARLVSALPDAAIVMIAGDHDTPRTAETGCILRLFAPLGIHVVDSEARRVDFPDRSLSVLAVPHIIGARPALTPNPEAQHNVLLLHGEIAGIVDDRTASPERLAAQLKPEELGATRWDYVALGHYHVHHSVAPNAYYSGSLDYTSVNPWHDLHEERKVRGYDPRAGGKGIIEWDTGRRAHTFHSLPVTRPLLDLPRLDASAMSAGEIDEAIQDRVSQAPMTVDDKMVRLVVENVSRHVARQMDAKAVRELKRRALHFHLDVRRPEIVKRDVSGAPGRRPSLNELVREKLMNRPLNSDIKRETFVELGLSYLARADATAAAAFALEEE